MPFKVTYTTDDETVSSSHATAKEGIGRARACLDEGHTDVVMVDAATGETFDATQIRLALTMIENR